MSKRFGIISNNAPSSTNYDSGLQFVPTFWLGCSGFSKKISKKMPFCTSFCAVRFCQFLNEYCINRLETWQALPVGTQNAGSMVRWKLASFPRVSVEYRHYYFSKNNFFWHFFFINWLRGSTPQMLRQAKNGQRVAPLLTALPKVLN